MAEVLAGDWVTIKEASRRKGTKPQNVQKWLKSNPQVETRRIGNVVVVRFSSLNEYSPRLG